MTKQNEKTASDHTSRRADHGRLRNDGFSKLDGPGHGSKRGTGVPARGKRRESGKETAQGERGKKHSREVIAHSVKPNGVEVTVVAKRSIGAEAKRVAVAIAATVGTVNRAPRSRPGVWCKDCKAFHCIPRNQTHHAALGCKAPYLTPRQRRDRKAGK